MKYNYIIRKTSAILLSAFSLFVTSSCIDSFESMNTDPTGIQGGKIELLNRIQAPQEALFPGQEHRYQVWSNLHVDIFAGYFMGVNDFGGANNYNYRLNESFNHGPFENYYLEVFKYTNRLIPECLEKSKPEMASILQIVQVCGMLTVVDTYGPAPYRCVKEGSSTYYYDSEEQIYSDLFAELKQAIDWMSVFYEKNPEGTPEFTQADKLCGGKPDKWLRFANTLQLRMAMRLVKVKPELSKEKAEAAYLHPAGLLTMDDTDVQLLSGNKIRFIEDSWNDSRVNANLISILEGYADPRLEKWIRKNGDKIVVDDQEALKANAKYVGVRQGVPIRNHTDYLPYSKTTFQEGDARVLMRPAEAYFLRAEGALRGWNMGGTAQSLYEQGIEAAMKSAFGPEGIGGNLYYYINGMHASHMPDFDWDKYEGCFGSADYVNPLDETYNIKGVNKVSLKWHEEDDQEMKLQRIITQKWIALYPFAFEAWAEFRRTGYPKLFPIPSELNYSNGEIDTDIQIRRLKFLEREYNSNRAEVEKAKSMLKGPDTGGTRLWWDIEGANF